jgi:poly(ribitol-phosphate) beta-N-acetylglucosaminyltransferase
MAANRPDDPPDVCVIIPVYNAMPYLTECLASVVGQSIGAKRLEIIAVDDGSTDGSGEELARFEQLYPGLVTVLHQANSGSPGGPCNRGLDVATGRFVFFLGADDTLWREALERLVAEADDYGSDVVAGKMVGVNGRYVHQALFTRTDHDVQLFESALPWSMSNTKLFRRELVERLGLRFPEDLPLGSDQPFTLEACLHAQRISVLADDSYYFALRRTDAGNITYRTRADVRLACAAEVMHRAAKLIEAGPHRDAILRRHFAWELIKVLTDGYLELDEATQAGICRGVAELANAYFTDRVRDGLPVRRRVVLCLAQAGKLDLLRDVVREQAEPGDPPLLLDGDRAFVRYAGFRQVDSVDDRSYEILSESVARWLKDSDQVLSLGWSRRAGKSELRAEIRVALAGLATTDPTRVGVRAVPERGAADRRSSVAAADVVSSIPTLRPTDDDLATIISIAIPGAELLARGAGKWTFVLGLEAAGRPHKFPLTAETLLPQAYCWQRGRAFRLSSRATKSGRLQLVVQPVSRRHAVGRWLRSLVTRAGRD